MSDDQPLFQKLRTAIEEKKVVVVVGSGVSCATTQKAPLWKSLIESAAQRCQLLQPSKIWFQNVQSLLNPVEAEDIPPEDRNDMLINAAELVEQKLKRIGEGDFATWLSDSFENLECDDPAVIQAIVDLDLTIVTTNYDDLISKASGLKYVTWPEQRKVSKVVRLVDRRVIHLHGHWDHPESVVLGIKSYEAVKNSEHTQTVMKSLATTKSLLFVGCGDDGLNDPNFGNFLTWLTAFEKDSQAEHRHYRLVREADFREPIGRLYSVPYGNKFADLPDFIRQLQPILKVEPEQSSDKRARPGEAVTAPTPRVETPPSISHYLSRLADETSRLKLLGMGRSFQIELPISEAYVPLRTCPSRNIEQKHIGKFSDHHVAADLNVELSDVFRVVTQNNLHGVVLLGEPGAGKTTGARQLAWQLASGQRLPKDLGLPTEIIPVLLRFRNLSRSTIDSGDGLRKFLISETHSANAPDGLTSPGDDLWNQRGGALLWILDGLDEVTDPEDRRKVSGWIQEALNDRPQDRFLVTCRFAGYERDGVRLGSGFAEFHVRPLDANQIEQFVHDWYTTAYRQLGGSEDPGSRSDSLLEMLSLSSYQTQRIRELCSNPLMLTILCIVYHEDQKLPQNRFDLYKRCVEVLLAHWRHGVTLSPFDSVSAQAVLAGLAFWMHSKQDRKAAPLHSLAKQAEASLARIKEEAGLGLDGVAFLDRMKDETGILAGEQNGQLSFLHLSFQEFLAANHAAANGKAKQVAQCAAESWWQEVALLSLRYSERYCCAFFKELLKSGIAELHPGVADMCLSESPWLPVKPFFEVLKTGHPAGQVAAVLRMLRSRTAQVPGLAEVVLPLAESDDESVRSLAGEILAQLGIVDKVPTLQKDIVFLASCDLTMVRIPAGEFEMGSTLKGLGKENPVHTVRISQDFLLGRYPVTNAQYGEYLKAAGKKVQKPDYWDDRRFNQPEQPVVGVSWNDAQEFCEWAGCRLPTEAEWEYACRAGTTTAFSFGDKPELLDQHGWYDKNSSGQTQPVGTKLPNPWGLHDMHGNVWEWCQDWYGEYGKSLVVDPAGPATGTGRVLRGGSWNDPAGDCRSSFRFHFQPEYRYGDVGFRVARTL